MKHLISKLTMVAVTVGASLSFAGWSKTGESIAQFQGSGPAGFKIEGKTKDVDVKDDGKNITVIVKLTTLETGIGLRDDHMRNKYIDVAKYPDATLTLPTASVKLEDGKTNEGEASGTFGVHGKTKNIPFKYKASCKVGVCDIEGNADINLKDYDINVPSYLGVTVKPDIKVKATFQMKNG